MPITFIGDIHTHFERLFPLIPQGNPCVQVGDLGVGLYGIPVPQFPANFHFIAGNHDDRMECANNPSYLGHYGYNSDLALFFVSGAQSTDFKIGNDHWDHEELNFGEQNEAIELYEQVKPRIVVSHDCPAEAQVAFFDTTQTLTRMVLQSMLDIHRPDVWVFGHHHCPMDQVIDGTRFICLGIDEVKTI